jgi:two-component sensor histidine kinase
VISGPDTFVDAQHSLLLTLVLHELATNAVKYGALSNGSGQVRLRWDLAESDGRAVRLHWEEVGGPAVTAPVQHGFGSRLIEQVLGKGSGSTRLEYAPAGLQCSFAIAVSDPT